MKQTKNIMNGLVVIIYIFVIMLLGLSHSYADQAVTNSAQNPAQLALPAKMFVWETNGRVILAMVDSRDETGISIRRMVGDKAEAKSMQIAWNKVHPNTVAVLDGKNPLTPIADEATKPMKLPANIPIYNREEKIIVATILSRDETGIKVKKDNKTYTIAWENLHHETISTLDGYGATWDVKIEECSKKRR